MLIGEGEHLYDKRVVKPQLNMMLLTFPPGRTLLWLVVMAEAHFAEADAFARLKILEGAVQVCSGPIFVLPYAGDADKIAGAKRRHVFETDGNRVIIL